MKVLARFFKRLRNFTFTEPEDERLREEIDTHIDMQLQENLAAGMTPQQAKRQARMKFGNTEAITESYHSERSLPSLESLSFDLRYAFRSLRKSPAFTIVALVTLTLGIGANIVVFGVVNSILLHPLAVEAPQNLYQLRHLAWTQGKLLTTPYPTYVDLRDRNTTFSGMMAVNAYSQGTLRAPNGVINAAGDEVSSNYFDVLGVKPQLGRFFHSVEEHGPNSLPYIVLSDRLWRTKFQADPNLVGATVELKKHPFTVIGITSPEFHGTEKFVWPDYWLPIVNEQQIDGYDYLHQRTSVAVTVIGRLKSGVTAKQATDDLNAIGAELAREHPETDDGQPLRLIHPGLMGDEGDVIRGFLLGVTALAALVLGAACTNLASLFAARTADRRRELALRVALGSTRGKLIRQLLTEAMIVSVVGGVAGLTTAAVLLKLFNHWLTSDDHVVFSLDFRVYLLALLVSFTSALLFGIAPARQAWVSSPLQMMKGVQSTDHSRFRFVARDLLLGLQIAICTLLVAASLVAVRGMIRVMNSPMGFDPRGAMLVHADFSDIQVPDDQALVRTKQLLNAIQNVAGVTALGTVSRTPMTGGIHGVPVFSPLTTEFKLNNALLSSYVFNISPDYFKAAGTRLISGRDVSWNDTVNTPRVAIVNREFARKLWGETPAIGKRFILAGKSTEVIGVAEGGKYHDLREASQPAVYIPLSQSSGSETVFIVRSKRSADEMSAELQRVFRVTSPGAPVTVEKWEDTIAGELFPAKAAAGALGTMGILAVMLAITGVFGMASYSVSRRIKELGVRAALGARNLQMVRAAVGRPVSLLCLGALVGVVAALLSNRLLASIVYQANSQSPAVIFGTACMMTMLGIVAVALPTQRALSIDPSKLMRED